MCSFRVSISSRGRYQLHSTSYSKEREGTQPISDLDGLRQDNRNPNTGNEDAQMSAGEVQHRNNIVVLSPSIGEDRVTPAPPQQSSVPSTVKDVARLAGVSTATVSRVVNSAGNVSPETMEKVTNAIFRLQYVPNGSAAELGHANAGIRRERGGKSLRAAAQRPREILSRAL